MKIIFLLIASALISGCVEDTQSIQFNKCLHYAAGGEHALSAEAIDACHRNTRSTKEKSK